MTDRQTIPNTNNGTSFFGTLLAASSRVVWLPFEVIGRTTQVLFALFVLVLHPQFKWLAEVVAQSNFVQNTIRPVFQTIITNVYEPYFAYLKQLPPYWATFSIAVPLAVLEPAKFVATVMIAAHPKIGALLWLFLQGVGFILIDKTWAAVRPQARKIRLVARIHAWIWLTVEHGKYWIKTSFVYRTLLRWRETARRRLFVFFGQFAPRRRKRTS